jgi:hypothetical protein
MEKDILSKWIPEESQERQKSSLHIGKGIIYQEDIIIANLYIHTKHWHI